MVAMPNTIPAVDSAEIMQNVLQEIEKHAAIRVLQTGALTTNRAGDKLTDAKALKANGAIALTDDGSGVPNAVLMLQALTNARDAGLPVIEHCEDHSVAAGGVMHLGNVSQRLGLLGQSGIVEELIVARDAILAKEAGWGVHVQHISSAGSVAQVRFAQSQDINVTAEATPHHICLTDEACSKYGTNAKMNPPLRSENDRQAIIAALQDNTIAAIATDHAPHAASEKAVGFAEAPFGIIGLEAAVPVCLTELYHTGILSLSQFVAKFTSGPRRILGLPYGSLAEGAPADVTVLDLELDHTLDVSQFRSRSHNCPYDGWKCRGKAVGVAVGGQWIYSEMPEIAGVI